jgi:ATP-dependent exoDNAse (exonuclease V) beta subunit
VEFTDEQFGAIERRDGDLLLDASAGSGKTSVLVERFVRSVLDDGIEVGAILAITFTDKAAAELRERIRARLRELGAVDEARATEGAFISTIHGFCARVLRTHALAAGIDPRFEVLDELETGRLADAAFDAAISDLQDTELIASYGAGPLRGAILGTYAELRSRGDSAPRLPPLGPGTELESARRELHDAATAVARELGALADPSAKAREALARLERVAAVADVPDPWPADLDQLRVPGGNGAALSTATCAAYEATLQSFRRSVEHRRAKVVRAALDRLLRGFSKHYAERKRARSGVDFEDLELIVCDLFQRDGELLERYARRFERIMVDELQDTNSVQLGLISAISRNNMFAVGDAQQSIYGFRHAEVELFEALGERLDAVGRRATLRTNFRSRPEILSVVNVAFEIEIGDRFRPVRPGRTPAGEQRVELLVVDKGEQWAAAPDGVGSPWRIAEARALAGRLRELIDGGVPAGEVVVLTRASTDLRTYERALEEQAIPTYLIGGKGYWSHPQVMDLVAYLRALCNPRDEEFFYELLASPLVGVSIDALVLVADAARLAGRDPWWVIAELEDPPRLDSADPPLRDELAEADRESLHALAAWFGRERRLAPRLGVEELIERAMLATGYDLAVLAMPGGERRLANVRKLMRLGREYEERYGRDLRGFLGLVGTRATGPRADARESEAPVEGEALDAVRLMTIHRAKGLEFGVVAVADLGREPWRRGGLLRVGADGRLGLRLARPGTGRPVAALDYELLGQARAEADSREERRIFYVAMTRAKERLILSGAAKLGDDGLPPEPAEGAPCAPIGWIARAVSSAGVEPAILRAEDVRDTGPAGARGRPGAPGLAAISEPPTAARHGAATLSYSALAAYERCGYRFYLERVLGLPPVPAPGGQPASAAAAGQLSASERGLLAHLLLERLDFRRPVRPGRAALVSAAEQLGLPAAPEEVADLVEAFIASPLLGRLAKATDVRREESFSFLLQTGTLITGAFDVVAREPGGGLLVVDYKSDKLEGADPGRLVQLQYRIQRLIYALAAIRSGAETVEVAHVFLERPREPVVAAFAPRARSELERQIADLAGGVERQEFSVSEEPWAGLCSGCPGEGGLCSWPLDLTRRPAADRLF